MFSVLKNPLASALTIPSISLVPLSSTFTPSSGAIVVFCLYLFASRGCDTFARTRAYARVAPVVVHRFVLSNESDNAARIRLHQHKRAGERAGL
jgi:hypothetical protein